MPFFPFCFGASSLKLNIRKKGTFVKATFPRIRTMKLEPQEGHEVMGVAGGKWDLQLLGTASVEACL